MRVQIEPARAPDGGPLTGQFTEPGASPHFGPASVGRGLNITVWGEFVGLLQLQRSFDEGGSWHAKWPAEVYEIDAPRSFSDEEPEPGVLYRLECLSLASGAADYRISQ